MKKKYFVILMTVCCIGISSFVAFGEESTESQTKDTTDVNYDFRKFKWGDSQETVEEIEGTPNDEGDMKALDAHYIYYSTTLAGKDAELGYYFCDEGLFQTRFIMTERHSNDNMYIDDYEDIREALTKKYGEPSLDTEYWENDSKKEYYADDKGNALSFGYLKYVTIYVTDTTTVGMLMSADNYNISTTIDFQSNDISAGEADYSDDF